MSEKIASEVISRRRAFSVLGLAALSIAAPSAVVTVLPASVAEAQPASPPLAPRRETRRPVRRRVGAAGA
jgi:hypothetical protein